ncbi:MAG: DNA primase [Prevotella sp.]|nr:DNA primase [Prevotella sp.]
MIDRATVDKIISAANIVDVVGEFVTLRKSGVNYKGLCPFHDDKNPSFMVSPSKNICHCFVCGKGGTPAGFLMEHEQMTYPDALRWLAKKYNIEIEERELTPEERKEQGARESMFIVNEWAMNFFHDTLLNDPDGIAIGKQYFRSRAIRDDIIEKFHLGYAPQNRQALSAAALKAGYQAEYLLRTGLCYEKSSNHSLVDRYSGRVIFPWLNVSGKVVAFGGRLLDTRTKGVAQKYVNSPDSEIYHKERELYGLYQAKKQIVKDDRVFMVEGYTDVIAMHQAGIENVVANSGTALSIHQIKLLHRFTQNITLLYDGDEAGIHAAMRGTDMLLQDGMNIKVLLLPDGDDPDSFSRKHSAQELKEYIEKNQTDFITFKMKLTVENVSDPVKRSGAISGIVKSISVIPDPILRSTYLSEVAMRLGMKEQTLINSMNQMIGKERESRRQEEEREAARKGSDAQYDEIGALTNTTSVENGTASSANPVNFIGIHDIDEQTREVERLLIQSVVRDGEKVIFENIQTDDGQTVNLTVAQYIDFDLGQDGLLFHNDLYNRILEEAVAHSGEAGFVAESYFMQHSDIAISKLSLQLAVDRHQLGRGFQLKEREDALRQRVLHLVLDLRMDVIEKKLKDVQTKLRQVGTDVARARQLMEDYKSTQELRDMLAKRLGNDLVI